MRAHDSIQKKQQAHDNKIIVLFHGPSAVVYAWAHLPTFVALETHLLLCVATAHENN